jgi:hypothetical protein
MHAPGVGAAMFRHSQEIAVSRRGIDANQHRHCALEDFIVQTYTNAGQVLLVVDDARLLRGQLEHVMNVPMLIGTPSRSRMNSTTPRYDLRQRQAEAIGTVLVVRQDRRSHLPGALALLLRHPALTPLPSPVISRSRRRPPCGSSVNSLPPAWSPRSPGGKASARSRSWAVRVHAR